VSSTGNVTLPTVYISSLTSNGATAGATPFTLDLAGCTAGSTVNAFFEAGAGVDTTTGKLINTTAGGAGNVVVQLFPANNLTTHIKAGDISQVTAPDVTGVSTFGGTLSYVAQYYALAATTQVLSLRA